MGWEGGWKGQCVLICHISSLSFPGLLTLLMKKMFVFPAGWGTDSRCRMARLTLYGSMSCFHKALLAPSLHKCCSLPDFHQVSVLSTHPPYKWLIPLCLWQFFPRAGLWATFAVLFLGYWQGLAFYWEGARDKSPSFLSQKVSVVVQGAWRASPAPLWEEDGRMSWRDALLWTTTSTGCDYYFQSWETGKLTGREILPRLR